MQEQRKSVLVTVAFLCAIFCVALGPSYVLLLLTRNPTEALSQLVSRYRSSPRNKNDWPKNLTLHFEEELVAGNTNKKTDSATTNNHSLSYSSSLSCESFLYILSVVYPSTRSPPFSSVSSTTCVSMVLSSSLLLLGRNATAPIQRRLPR